MSIFKGSGVAIITPMNEETIDLRMFERLIDLHIEASTQAIIVAGTTGESATLSEAEKLELFNTAVKRARGRLAVIANIGTNATKQSVEMAQKAQALGVDALLAVAPYYNKPSQKGLIKHFTQIAGAATVPVILYNVPGRTGVNIDVSTVQTLSAHPMIKGIKEAAGDTEQVRAMIEATPDDFALYSGNDDLYYDTLALGGDGVISVVANIAASLSQQLYEQYLTDAAAAKNMQETLDILNEVMFIGPNPVPIKTALTLHGYRVGGTRLPLVGLDAREVKSLRAAMERYGGLV